MNIIHASYNGNKIIASDIDAVDYRTKYRKQITCCSEGCHANLVWVAGDNNRKSFFRKANYEVHSNSCPYFAEETINTDKTIIEKVPGSYSNEQIRNKHAHAIQKRRDELGLTKKRRDSNNRLANKKPVNYKQSKDKTKLRKKSQLSSDGKIVSDEVNKTRASSTPAKMPKNITPAMIGNDITIMSDSITIIDDMITSINDEKSSIKLTFPEAFTINAGGESIAHELQKELVNTITKRSSDRNFVVCVTGGLLKSTDPNFDYNLPVINPILISVNLKNPYTLINDRYVNGGE